MVDGQVQRWPIIYAGRRLFFANRARNDLDSQLA
jgi:hypothetical protein